MSRALDLTRMGALLGCALIFSCPRSAEAAPAEAAPLPVELDVDTQQLEAALAERLDLDLRDALATALVDAGFEVVHGGAGVRVETIVTMPDTEMRTYAISLLLEVDGERELIADAQLCESCPEQDVVDRARGYLDEAMQRLAPASEPEAGCPEPVIEIEQRGMPIGPVGLTGALTTVGGVATVGAGALVFSLGKVGVEAPAPRPVGIAIMSVGAALTLGGLAAFIVDQKVLEPRKEGRTTGFAVDVGPKRAGLIVFGRF